MQKQKWVGLIAVVAIAFGVGKTFAQDDAKNEAAPAANWRAKTAHHAGMAETVGEFDVAVEIFMAPGAPAQKAAATAKRAAIMNGLYVEESFAMGPFQGRMTMGYDTVRKKYVSSWVDIQNPVMSFSYGTEKDGVITFTGEEPDMMSGALGKTKSTIKLGGADSWIMTMYRITDKGEQMTMRLTYTRKK